MKKAVRADILVSLQWTGGNESVAPLQLSGLRTIPTPFHSIQETNTCLEAGWSQSRYCVYFGEAPGASAGLSPPISFLMSPG
jgi:hypothetical protein